MTENRKIHPIGYVAKQTGLSTHVIRVWEKRYGTVEPARTPTGRRLYSESDIHLLKLLRRATRSGHRIAQLSELEAANLQEIAKRKFATELSIDERMAQLSAAKDLFDACRSAVLNLDKPAFGGALNRAAVCLTRPALSRKVVIPLLEDIGDRWAKGSLKFINEHMASSILRSFLWDMLHAYRPPPGARKIVFATPSEHWHELGALVAAITATEAGWSVHYFGPNLPAEEIAAAAAINQAKAVALSIVYRAGETQMLREIKKLKNYLINNVTLVIGGSGVRRYQAELNQIGARYAEDVGDLYDILNKFD